MKYFTVLLLFVCCHALRAQGFYDINTIQEIRIYFAFNDWDFRMDTAKAGTESYILADSVTVNGVSFPNCGVKYKGNSSYDASQNKNPLHIKLDFDKNADYQGFEDIKLGNGWSDNSMIREPLGYALLRQYMDAPRGNFAKVWINDDYYGLMNNAEDIGNAFLFEHFYSSRYPFIKCNPASIGVGLGNGPNLQYLGVDPGLYDEKYELKSDTGWLALIGLCDTLNNHFTDFDRIADIDRFIWMLAFNNVMVNLDSYTGAFRQNYYLYRDHNRQWLPVVWDLNMCFGGFTIAGGTAGALTATNMPTMSYTLHKSESGWPLIQKLLNDPTFSKMYYAHMRTINQENFQNASYKLLAQTLHDQIDEAVENDPNLLSTYDNFQQSLVENTMGAGGLGFSPGIFKLMDSRSAYLANVLSATPPVISNIVAGNAVFGSNVTITTNVSNATAVYLGYRYQKSQTFNRVPMYDDGAHDDGAAGDLVFGGSCPVLGSQVQYYIYAENAGTGAFSPERAEFEYHTLPVSLDQAQQNEVVINEVTANNEDGMENEKGKIRDWIEFYNNTGKALDISNLYVSNDPADLQKWQFPTHSFIAPFEHLLVFADDLDDTYVYPHVNFDLSKSSDHLLLGNGDGVWDELEYTEQPVNQSMARCPDGTGLFYASTTRTPGIANTCTSAANEPNGFFLLNISPNPVSEVLNIDTELPVDRIELFAENGRLMLTTQQLTLKMNHLKPGVYWVRVVDQTGQITVRRVVKI